MFRNALRNSAGDALSRRCCSYACWLVASLSATSGHIPGGLDQLLGRPQRSTGPVDAPTVHVMAWIEWWLPRPFLSLPSYTLGNTGACACTVYCGLLLALLTTRAHSPPKRLIHAGRPSIRACAVCMQWVPVGWPVAVVPVLQLHTVASWVPGRERN